MNRHKTSAEGWIASPTIGVEMRRGSEDRLCIRMAGNPATQQELPPD